MFTWLFLHCHTACISDVVCVCICRVPPSFNTVDCHWFLQGGYSQSPGISVCDSVCVCVFSPSMLKLLGLEGVGVHVAGFDKVRDPRLPASANRQQLSPTHLLFTFSFVTFFPHQVPAGCINYLWEKDELIHC